MAATGWVKVSNFGRLALVAAISSFVSASAMVVITTPTVRADVLRTVQAGPGRVSAAAVRKGADGHFWAVGKVNGQPVRFLVDTGSTAVALTPADAARLGFDPERLEYAQSVVTAAGRSRAAKITLSSVSVGGARLADVSAMVVESGLDASLLGMSYLGRLSRFEATRDSLRLEL